MPTRSTGFRKKGIIANPNCSTAQLVVVLKPLHDFAKIKRVVVSTYQSVSGAGKDGMDELDPQTKSVYSLGELEVKKFTKRIAFNVIPHIDVFMDDGYTKEEWKMVVETKKILDPEDQADRDLRARAGLHRPFGSGEYRIRERDHHRRGARNPAQGAGRVWSSTSARTAVTRRRTRRPATTRPMSAACARIRPSSTASRCGACPTICARARRSTRSRSPRA